MTKQTGPLCHVLMSTTLLSTSSGPYSKTLRVIKKLAKRHKIPSMVSKTGFGTSGLVYAGTRNKLALQCFERDVRGMTNQKQKFATIVPTTAAPVPEGRPVRLPGQRFVDVEGLSNFGAEMARRSLGDWWADIMKKSQFKD